MRKLVVAVIALAGFGGLVGLGALTALLAGSGGGQQDWGACNANLGVWGERAGGQQDAATLGEESLRIAAAIITIGEERGLPPRAAQIAIQAGKTESNLRNLNHGDRDSLGIFQMRPSMGWGTVAQVTDVEYQIHKFYDVLLEVPGWQEMRPGTAAQRVERSAYPLRYHRWEAMAAHLVSTEGDLSGLSGCENMAAGGVLAGKAMEYAHTKLGSPYVWGATGPNTFDCSGLTQQAWSAAGVTIPRVSQEQYDRGGAHVPLAEARTGDLVFWGYGRDPDSVHHVALYLGDNKVLHAPQPGESVEITELWDSGELLPHVVRPVPEDPPVTESTEPAEPTEPTEPAGTTAPEVPVGRPTATVPTAPSNVAGPGDDTPDDSDADVLPVEGGAR
ncbi:NlpC/P60 family protein [Saccharopolyspora cebuensis]|uniref:NlpC/P60 family protein n=1 Tax=Saccharopolyspora cebuensis TaxID=418759 RepID=A0ABV4CFB8_9PSEU